MKKKQSAPVKKKPISPSLATPTHLKAGAVESIAKALNPLIADAFTLYVKTKNFHWHLSGPHFRDYHLLFDEQAGQVLAMIDVLAERVRKLGGLTIRSIGHIGQLKRLRDDDELFVSPDEMLERLLQDNREYAASLLEAHEVCAAERDVATASILEVFIDETERRIWFLHETEAYNCP